MGVISIKSKVVIYKNTCLAIEKNHKKIPTDFVYTLIYGWLASKVVHCQPPAKRIKEHRGLEQTDLPAALNEL